jgi:hypothetical protein
VCFGTVVVYFDSNNKEQISISPNPYFNNNKLTISNISSEVVKGINVYDIKGQLIYTSSSNEFSNTIELNNLNLPLGIYNVQVITESGVSNQKLLVK